MGRIIRDVKEKLGKDYRSGLRGRDRCLLYTGWILLRSGQEGTLDLSEDGPWCLQEDLKIEPETEGPGVLDIQTDHLIECQLVLAAYLPQTCHARDSTKSL